jgi:hypothetical protein
VVSRPAGAWIGKVLKRKPGNVPKQLAWAPPSATRIVQGDDPARMSQRNEKSALRPKHGVRIRSIPD